MKKKVVSLALASAMILGSVSMASAAPYDLVHKTNNSAKNYSFLQFMNSNTVFNTVTGDINNYLLTAKDGKLYSATQVDAKIAQNPGMSFEDAVVGLTPVEVDAPVEGELKVVEVSAINAREIKVTFNNPVNRAAAIDERNYQFVKNSSTLTTADFVNGPAVTGEKGTLVDDGKAVVFRLIDSSKLANSDRYSVHVSTNVLGADFNPIEKYVDIDRIFSDLKAPKLLETLLVGNQLVFKFNEPVNVNKIVVKVDGEQIAVAGTVAVRGTDSPTNYHVITPAIVNTDLLEVGTYDVVIYNVEDILNTNPNTTSVITTGYSISEDKNAPVVESITAVNSRSFHVKFSEEVQSLVATNFEVVKGNHTFADSNVLVGLDTVADKTGRTWRVSVDESVDVLGAINPLYTDGQTSVSLSVTTKEYRDNANLLGAPITRTVALAQDTKRPELVGTSANAVNATAITVKYDGNVAINDATKISVKNKEGVVLTGLGTISAATDTVTIDISGAAPAYATTQTPYTVEFGANAVEYTKNLTNARYDVNDNRNNALVATANPANPVDAVVVKLSTIIPTSVTNTGIMTIDFGERMDSTAINSANYSIDGVALNANTKVEFIGGTEVVRLTLPEGKFTKSQTAKFTISNNVKTVGGSKVVADALTKAPVERIISFTDNAQPELAKAEFYVANATSTETNQLKVAFNENVTNLTADDFKVTVNGNKVNISSVVAGNTAKEAIFTLSTPINVNNVHVVLEAIAEGANNATMDTTDAASNKLSAGTIVVSGKALQPVVVVNQAPTVANPIADTVGTVAGGMVTVDASTTFTDADGDTLAITGTSGDTNVATVVMNGTDVEVTPVAVGTATISVVANDGNGGTVTETFDIVVGNSAPTVTIADQTETTTTGPWVLDLSTMYSDVDGDTVTFNNEVSSDTGIATVSLVGSTLTVTEATTGTTTISVDYDDGNGGTGTATFDITIQ